MGIALAKRSLWLIALFVIFAQSQPVAAHSDVVKVDLLHPTPAYDKGSGKQDYPLQAHPLPKTLARWQDTTGTGDYFSQIKPTPVGYLIWSQFPIKVYVERPTELADSSPSARRFQDWVNAVIIAVEEWSIYLPLEVVNKREIADVAILRSHPALQASINRETGQFNIPRARAAQTRYEFYLRPGIDLSQQVLSQRFTIQLSPNQTVDYTLATARHELGHALGIWGHSPLETDIMYFSQVRNPPSISARDINTLKRIYEQPTRLGWTLPESISKKKT